MLTNCEFHNWCLILNLTYFKAMNHYDVIVVGTGFSSSFFLYKFKERYPDKKILVLERGRFAAHGERLEAVRERKPLENYVDSAEILKQKNQDNHAFAFQVGFGGGSNCWWGCTPRFMPNDFRIQSLYGVGNDWPLTYDELSPFYEEAEHLMQISGPLENPYPKTASYPLRSHKLLPFDQLLQDKYGTLVQAQATARASERIASRAACCGSSACSLCPVNAKFTIENGMRETYEGLSLVYGAEVYALDLGGTQASKIHYRVGKEEKTDSADFFVLGANPIFNAHILLNSGDTHPLLGKGISEQRSITVDVNLGIHNVGGSSLISANMWMLYEGDFRKEYAACLIESQNSPMMMRLEKGKLRHIAQLKCIFEDLYQNRNGLEKSADPFLPSLTYHGPSQYLKKGVSNLEVSLKRILAGLPVESMHIPSELNETESHIIGGHIMGKEIENSVVDSQQIHHTYRNVMMLGAGSFSSMSPANPTLTLSALSLRSAAQLEL